MSKTVTKRKYKTSAMKMKELYSKYLEKTQSRIERLEKRNEKYDVPKQNVKPLSENEFREVYNIAKQDDTVKNTLQYVVNSTTYTGSTEQAIAMKNRLDSVYGESRPIEYYRYNYENIINSYLAGGGQNVSADIFGSD